MHQIRHSLRQGAVSTKAPLLLRERILRETRQQSRLVLISGWHFARAAVVVATVLVAVAVVFHYRWLERDSLTDMVATLMEYHAAYESGERSLSMIPSDLQDFQATLERRLGYGVSIPHAAFAGYTLKGADIVEQGPGKFAYLHYQRNGKTIGYIIFENSRLSIDLPETLNVGEITLHIGEEKENNLAAWKRSGLLYVILTTEDRSELIEYARRCILLF